MAENGRVEMDLLPDVGPALVGPVPLPAGRRHFAEDSDEPVAWVTEEPMADSGLAWLALSALHAQTGLVPVLLRAVQLPHREGPPAFGFDRPPDAALLDQMAAGDVLAAMWADRLGDPDFAANRAPFGEEFPGLAPAETERLAAAELHQAVSALSSLYLGLVSARRPADVLAAVGWSAAEWDEPGTSRAQSLQIGAVLRSWEARFGARLLQIGGEAHLRVLVERPPRASDQAQLLAAEHYAFAVELDQGAGDTVSSIAASLAGRPIWTFTCTARNP
jgi:hypothetical protein